MTTEERISQLEQELSILKERRGRYIPTPFARASENCSKYFDQIKQEHQHYFGKSACEQAARSAFKERFDRFGSEQRYPSQYIKTDEEAGQYFKMFQRFADIYQEILTTKEI